MSRSTLQLSTGLIFILISAILYSARTISIAVLAISIGEQIDILNQDVVGYANDILPITLLPLIIVSFLVGLLFIIISLFSIFAK
ncbi:hypothetical protein DH09_05630 [Bacillaceae bacterium JMAK1]|nr:hypothetical protein DH09_05630 [Bacillaceae bacterium JMAK1]